jgi:hypothetical protein
VLLGQGYRTPRGAVIDEYGVSNGGMMMSREFWYKSEKKVVSCHFVHHKSNLKSPGIEPGSIYKLIIIVVLTAILYKYATWLSSTKAS